MLKYLRLTFESFLFALSALKSNLLRTILSLLGVTIGIFAIIAVFTMVDSLETKIKSSFNFLGDKVVFVQKWPWLFESDYPWWRFLNRPLATMSEYKFVERRLDGVDNAGPISLHATTEGKVVKYKSSSINNISVTGCTFNYNLVTEMPIEAGRYFTSSEVENGRSVCILGATVAEGLFGIEAPVGKFIILKGRKMQVVGVIKRQGESMMGTSQDNQTYIPFQVFAGLYKIKKWGGVEPTISIKGAANATPLDMQNLEGEIRGLMRTKRGLKPAQEDNFAINKPEQIASAVQSIFKVIGIAGGIIGSFSILVGGFGIANIMFVSVKERTNLIGIQKSLGARNYFILYQFLFEAIFLSIIGGAAGILIVYLITLIPQDIFYLTLSLKNVTIGFGISLFIGVLAGIMPALVAARLDPVEAIRSK